MLSQSSAVSHVEAQGYIAVGGGSAIMGQASFPSHAHFIPRNAPPTRTSLPVRDPSPRTIGKALPFCSSQVHSTVQGSLKYQGNEKEQLSSENHFTNSAVGASFLELLNFEEGLHFNYLALDRV